MLVHHELCFGCGRTNLFGLLSELERTARDTVVGRCFIKQDHQGPDAGNAHPGIVAAALAEAMAFAGGPGSHLERLTVEFTAPVPVGVFLDLRATRLGATACVDGTVVARAGATHAGG